MLLPYKCWFQLTIIASGTTVAPSTNDTRYIGGKGDGYLLYPTLIQKIAHTKENDIVVAVRASFSTAYTKPIGETTARPTLLHRHNYFSKRGTRMRLS